MRLTRFAFVLSLCSIAMAFASTAIATASAALDRFGRFLIDTIAPTSTPFALAGMPNTPMSIDGVALARSTQHGLRHEAGTARRSAPRKV